MSHEKELTEGERRFVQQTIGENPVLVQWVKKKNRKKVVQDRLLVVGKYRVYSIKRTKAGKKQVQRMGHLFSLVEIFSDDLDMVELKFKDFKLVAQATNIGIDLPRILMNLYNKFGYTFSEKVYPKIVFLPEGRNPPALDEVYLGIAHGFVETYLAACDFFNIPANSDVVLHMEDIAGADSHQLKLSKFIGIAANHTEYAFSLVPVFAALRHNTFFSSLSCHEKTRKEFVTLLADAMLFNKTLTSINVEGLETEEGWTQFGESLKVNPSCSLVELCLSNNVIGDKGATALANGLCALDHSLLTVRMANTKLQPSGAASMFKAFGQAAVPFQSLEEVNFSGNALGGPGSIALADWLLKSNLTCLKKIYLANCQMELPGVLDAVRTSLYAVVEVLDITGGKLEDYASQLLVSYLGRAQALKELICVGCGISGHNMTHILNAIKANQNLMDLRVDLSNNELNSLETAIHAFSKSLSEVIHIRWIGLRELNLPRNSLQILATAVGVSSTITEFDLSGNFKGRTEFIPSLESLVNSLNTHPCLVSLTLDGKGQSILAKSVAFLFSFLGEICTLQELSIRGHGFGDDMAKDLFDVLRWNVSLRILDVDNNNIGPVGWLAAKRCLHANRTLTELRYPKLDIAKMLGREKEKHPQYELIRKLFDVIKSYTENNRTGTLDKRGPPFIKPVHSFVKKVRAPRADSTRVSTVFKDDPNFSPTNSPPPPPPAFPPPFNGHDDVPICVPAPFVEEEPPAPSDPYYDQ